jgi:hypothetical protein
VFDNIQIVDAGGGNDTVQATASDDNFQILNGGAVASDAVEFRQFERIDGGAGNNSISGLAAGSVFSVNGLNQGAVDGLGFVNVQNLLGGAGADTFTVSAGNVGLLDGGGSNDTLNTTGATSRWVVTTAGNSLNGGAFAGIEVLNDSSTDFGLQSDYDLTLASANRILFSGADVQQLTYTAPTQFDVSGAEILVDALQLSGTAILRSAGSILGQGTAPQIGVDHLVLQAGGTIDLDTQIAQLTAAAGGNIAIRQTGNLTLHNISSSGGDISVIGDADLWVTRVATAGPGSGSATLRTTLGNLYLTDVGYGQVNVTAGQIVLDAFLNIGTIDKPFYLYSVNAPRITALQYVNPLLVGGTPKPIGTGKSVASLTEVIASSGLRSAVQSYGADVVAIDPSIFTALLPFSVDEEALALPEDQQPE